MPLPPPQPQREEDQDATGRAEHAPHNADVRVARRRRAVRNAPGRIRGRGAGGGGRCIARVVSIPVEVMSGDFIGARVGEEECRD